MKNIFALILGFLTVSMLLVGSNVWAAASGQTVTTSITDNYSKGPGITGITLSPNVSLNYNGVAANYEMCGWNSKGTVEYGVSSGTAGVWMHDATALTTLTTTNGDTVESWLQMGTSSGT